LLALFFTNPDRSYYLRELQRMLGYSAGNIRRELLKLQSGRLFETKQTGNLLYYSLNGKHPLFHEIKSIVQKTIGVEGAIRKALSSIEGIDIAFLYGSFAKGDARIASDIDLFIIGRVDERNLVRMISKAEKKLLREINYSLYSRADFMKKKREKDSFIRDILEGPKIFLVGGPNEL
jgi:predicted nucleotidyltransferase